MSPHTIRWPLRQQDALHRFIDEQKRSSVSISGRTNPSALGALIGTDHSGAWSLRPQLVVTATADEATEVCDAIRFFNPQKTIHHLPSFDFGPYSGIPPQTRHIAARVNFLYCALRAKVGDIFVGSVDQWLLRAPTPEDFLRNVFEFNRGDSFPESVADFLGRIGYTAVPVVEDPGTFALRGGILDLYSPAHDHPIRIELFGDMIDSIRQFDPVSQRSDANLESFCVLPSHLCVYDESGTPDALEKYRHQVPEDLVGSSQVQDVFQALSKQRYFPGQDWLLPFFFKKLGLPLDYFSDPVCLWVFGANDVEREHDVFLDNLKKEHDQAKGLWLRLPVDQYWATPEELKVGEGSRLDWSSLHIQSGADAQEEPDLEIKTVVPTEISQAVMQNLKNPEQMRAALRERFQAWREEEQTVIVAVENQNRRQRLHLLFEDLHVETQNVGSADASWPEAVAIARTQPERVLIFDGMIPQSVRWQDDHVIFLKDQDLLGKKRRAAASTLMDAKKAFAFNFGDLKPNDLIVHKSHGIGKYEGLRVMTVNGVDSEFIEIQYKDNDRLYVPVYRVGQIQKYSGPAAASLMDKLGGSGWEKTTTKVKKYLRDLAADLLALYAERARTERDPLVGPEEEMHAFENAFPYEETDDQLNAIHAVLKDLQDDKPMDRLVCGDVGFGKTEVAMRAVFRALQSKKQVAVIAPTTILTFQHAETFKKRFQDWPVKIHALNRFVSNAEAKKILAELKDGKVDVLIGTHRLLSSDVVFKDLGLLVIDEEQKFGVKHKEKIRQLKKNVDTLTLSATPIPRTLNMSLMGIRDLSLIATPPVDRLPTRTFVSKFDSELIRKAVMSELQRDGQVFFIHNRVQSIEGLAADLREILPEVRIAVAHGQMEEDQLEKTIVKFFNHEIDVLLCTTIIESGMDIPRANTMFINDAQMLGLSQLYQLRGRVGRSKERAYCYLLIPQQKPIDKEAQERLRVIQENSALGSGFRVAQYDLELRGGGDLLGEAQSGQVESVGYELFMELLEDAIQAQKGAPPRDDLEPEINVPIPALIPDKYIPDIRIRLAYYKSLSQIEEAADIDRIEEELRDQFGPPPDQVLNLMGLMLIRKTCKDLGVSDLSAGKQAVSVKFTEKTRLPSTEAVRLAGRADKKYSISPDGRLRVKMHEITWPKIYDELTYLLSLCKS